MQEQPKISVILPSLNVRAYIGECLESVLKQTLQEIEILCVDAGSTDGTLDVLEAYARLDGRIRLIHSERKSYGYQVNCAIEQAEGAYIGIVETDDLIAPEMYEHMYGLAERLDADVVKIPFCEYRGHGKRADCSYRAAFQRELPRERTFSVREYGQLLGVHASIWSGIYKTDYLRSARIRFVEAPGAGYVDVGFQVDTLTGTDKIAWLDEPCYYYRVDSAGSSTNQFRLSVMLERWKEVHEKLQPAQEIYDRYYGPYLLRGEYLNTFQYFLMLPTGKEERDLLQYNFSFISEEVIRAAVGLGERKKEWMLAYRRDPVAFYRRAEKNRRLRRAMWKTTETLLPRGSERRAMVKKVYFALTK